MTNAAPIPRLKTSPKYISYLRVSTTKQGSDGLGIDAQDSRSNACQQYQRQHTARVRGGGIGQSRREATARCSLREARLLGATLLVAKLDRLTRNVHFMSSLMQSGVDFVACDNPNANRLTIQLLTAVAEHECALISARTKAVLAAARARGVKLGSVRGFSDGEKIRGAKISAQKRTAAARDRARDIAPIISELKDNGANTLAKIAAGLSERGVLTATGKSTWSVSSVADLCKLI